MIEVKAIRKGFYGSLRQPGETFVIQSEKDLGSWMEVVKPAAGESAEKKPAAKK